MNELSSPSSSQTSSVSNTSSITMSDDGASTAMFDRCGGGKRKKAIVHGQFRMDDAGRKNSGGKPLISVVCLACAKEIMLVVTPNASRMSQHLVTCQQVNKKLKVEVRKVSQRYVRSQKALGNTVRSSTGNITDEVSANVLTSSAILAKRRSPKSLLQPPITASYRLYTKEKFRDIICGELEVILVRHESLNRLQDAVYQSNLAKAHTPAILEYLPVNTQTMFSSYINDMDEKLTQKIKNRLLLMQGHASLEVDGVTVTGGSKLFYTLSKGIHSTFIKTSTLGVKVHHSPSETHDMVTTLRQTEVDYSCVISNIACDNASVPQVKCAIKEIMDNEIPHVPILLTRDPSHCVNLLAKEAGDNELFSDLQVGTKKIVNFMNNDRIRCIATKLYETRTLKARVPRVKEHSETRIGKIAITFQSIEKTREFFNVVFDDEDYNRIFKKNEQHDELKKLVNDERFWKTLDIGAKFFLSIHICQNLLGKNNFPSAAYYPLMVALKNELHLLLLQELGCTEEENKALFDARNKLFDGINRRFNFDGVKPTETNSDTHYNYAGLLDKHHLWSYLMCPFRRELKCHMRFLPSKGKVMGEMLDFFSNNDAEMKKKLNTQAISYLGQGGEWAHFLPENPTLSSKWCSTEKAEAEAEIEKLRVNDVQTWVEKTHSVEGRLELLEVVEETELVKHVLKPLMSIRTTGSMSVERVAKPMKNSIVCRDRNRLTADKASMLLRVGKNLRYLHRENVNVRKIDVDFDDQMEEVEIMENSY